jgi:hypothetical protein
MKLGLPCSGIEPEMMGFLFFETEKSGASRARAREAPLGIEFFGPLV